MVKSPIRGYRNIAPVEIGHGLRFAPARIGEELRVVNT
jgi:hypothetical protein